jgi:hypothetical protein
MVHLRVYLTLALALLVLGNGAWTPANHIAVPDSLAPESLVDVNWQAFQYQDNKLPATGSVMGMDFRNSLAVNSNKPIDSGIAHLVLGNMEYQTSGHYFKIISVDVWVLDQDDNPVRRAMVYSKWYHNGNYLWDLDRVTDKNGHASLGLSTGVGGKWEVCVFNVVKSGWSTDPDPMVEMCSSINVP